MKVTTIDFAVHISLTNRGNGICISGKLQHLILDLLRRPIKDNYDLRVAVHETCSTEKGVITWGPISFWDTSCVTNMNRVFEGHSTFNLPIGFWDTSQVTSMIYMFAGASIFNQDISRWNTSKVTDMAFMFSSARAFNQPIGGWDVSMVGNMACMFMHAESFNQSLQDWKLRKLEDVQHMFAYAASFHGQVGDRVDAVYGKRGYNTMFLYPKMVSIPKVYQEENERRMKGILERMIVCLEKKEEMKQKSMEETSLGQKRKYKMMHLQFSRELDSHHDNIVRRKRVLL